MNEIGRWDLDCMTVADGYETKRVPVLSHENMDKLIEKEIQHPDITKHGYILVRGAEFVTRPEWNGWWQPVPKMNEHELDAHLQDCSTEMTNYILSLQAIRAMVKNERAQ